MEITPQNISSLFKSKWIPDRTTIKVQPNRNGEIVKGTVIDCRTYIDSFLVLLQIKGVNKSYYYPTDNFIYVPSTLGQSAASVLLENNPDMFYHNENFSITKIFEKN